MHGGMEQEETTKLLQFSRDDLGLSKSELGAAERNE